MTILLCNTQLYNFSLIERIKILEFIQRHLGAELQGFLLFLASWQLRVLSIKGLTWKKIIGFPPVWYLNINKDGIWVKYLDIFCEFDNNKKLTISEVFEHD